MKVSKARLFSVLRVRHADDRPFLAQALPDEFDTGDHPRLLAALHVSEADLTGPLADMAEELCALDARAEHGNGLQAERRRQLLESIRTLEEHRRSCRTDPFEGWSSR